MRRLENGRGRDEVAEHLIEEARRDPALVVGLDFAFSLPAWYLRARAVDDAPALWALIDVEADDLLRAVESPFWGSAGKAAARLGPAQEFRRTDLEMPAVRGIRPKSVFQLVGAGQVGPGSLRGMRLLHRLAASAFSVWPFQAVRPPVLIEIYPRVLTGDVVKSDARRRAAYLERVVGLDDETRARAATDDSAFDAAVSALVMWRHRAEIASLRAEPEYGLEGKIWLP